MQTGLLGGHALSVGVTRYMHPVSEGGAQEMYENKRQFTLRSRIHMHVDV